MSECSCFCFDLCRGQGKGLAFEDVLLTIPFPKSVKTANLTVTTGTFLYDEATKVRPFQSGPEDLVLHTKRGRYLAHWMTWCCIQKLVTRESNDNMDRLGLKGVDWTPRDVLASP
jgi:hypothetical protein